MTPFPWGTPATLSGWHLRLRPEHPPAKGQSTGEEAFSLPSGAARHPLPNLASIPPCKLPWIHCDKISLRGSWKSQRSSNQNDQLFILKAWLVQLRSRQRRAVTYLLSSRPWPVTSPRTHSLTSPLLCLPECSTTLMKSDHPFLRLHPAPTPPQKPPAHLLPGTCLPSEICTYNPFTRFYCGLSQAALTIFWNNQTASSLRSLAMGRAFMSTPWPLTWGTTLNPSSREWACKQAVLTIKGWLPKSSFVSQAVWNSECALLFFFQNNKVLNDANSVWWRLDHRLAHRIPFCL